jgi:predicted Zn-dependent peptidase
MRSLCAALAAMLCCSVTASAQTPSAAPSGLTLQVERGRLENGLRVVVAPDPTAPTAAIAVYYDVGSRAEEPGRTGFAHLFEHLMFEGTETLPKGEFDRLLTLRGADSNATTSEDRTNYFELLPAHALELGLWLEADRMRALAITAEAFENQRLTVMEERRQSYENQPYAPSFLRLEEIFYEGYFPYAHSTIGDMRDLEMPGLSAAEQLARVREFHARWYAPDNAVLAVAGDATYEQVMSLARRHFGSIPARGVRPWQDPAWTPARGERVERIEDPHAEAPAFHLAWHGPARRTPDHYAAQLLASILTDGESSRLYRALVRGREVLAEVDFGAADRRGPELLRLWGVCAEGHTPAEVRPLVDAEIARLVRDGVTAREMEKARNAVRAEFVFGLATPLHRALALGQSELYDGDATVLLRELDQDLTVTAADVQRVARTVLVRENRVVLDVIPSRP